MPLIKEYLQSYLYPSDPEQRAAVDKILFFDIGSLYKSLVDYFVSLDVRLECMSFSVFCLCLCPSVLISFFDPVAVFICVFDYFYLKIFLLILLFFLSSFVFNSTFFSDQHPIFFLFFSIRSWCPVWTRMRGRGTRSSRPWTTSTSS